MPIELIAEITPKNAGAFALVDDKIVRGGYRIVATLEDRDQITADRRKTGMLVYILESQTTYRLEEDGTWTEDGGGIGTRVTETFMSPNLAVGESWDFEIPMKSSTSMLLQLVVSAPSLMEIHSTPNYNDTNPFVFMGLSSHLADDGSTIMSDGSKIYGRRYSILANMESLLEKRVFGRLTNNGDSAQSIQVTMELLPQ